MPLLLYKRLEEGPDSTHHTRELLLPNARLMSESADSIHHIRDTLKQMPNEEFEFGLAPETQEERLRWKTGFFLSGGGLWGYMTASALTRLDEMGIEPDFVTGASAGSMVGAEYALNGTKRLKDNAVLDRFLEAFKPKVSTREMFDSNALRGIMRECLGDATMKDAKTDLKIIVSDVDHGRPIILDKSNYEGLLADAVAASSAIPTALTPMFMRRNQNGLFEFVDSDEYKPGSDVFMVVDGAVTSDMPIHRMRKRYPNLKMAVAININPGSHIAHKGGGVSAVIGKGMEAAMSAVRGAHRSLPRDWRHAMMQKMKGSGHIPEVATKTLFAFLTGAHIDDYGLRLIPEQGEYSVMPNGHMIPPVGKLSHEQRDTLMQSGLDAANEVENTHHLTRRSEIMAAHNQALGKLFEKKQASIAALAKKDREALREAV